MREGCDNGVLLPGDGRHGVILWLHTGQCRRGVLRGNVRLARRFGLGTTTAGEVGDQGAPPTRQP